MSEMHYDLKINENSLISSQILQAFDFFNVKIQKKPFLTTVLL